MRFGFGAPFLDPKEARPFLAQGRSRSSCPPRGRPARPKLVKLSHGNIAANTASIIEYLGLGPCGCRDHIAQALLFLRHVCGEHAPCAGAALFLTDLGLDDPAFWALVRRHGVTNVAGVPFSSSCFTAWGSTSGDLPSLRLHDPGGRAACARAGTCLRRKGARHGVDFCVMYGQTEAAPRMSWLPPDLAAEAPGSIGRAIPGGSAVDRDASGAAITEPGVSGELVYEGPNVMVGYAEAARTCAMSSASPISGPATSPISTNAGSSTSTGGSRAS
jgi:acyl-coenzyme A synthetase/AMP-(fatty) acid ligase